MMAQTTTSVMSVTASDGHCAQCSSFASADGGLVLVHPTVDARNSGCKMLDCAWWSSVWDARGAAHCKVATWVESHQGVAGGSSWNPTRRIERESLSSFSYAPSAYYVVLGL